MCGISKTTAVNIPLIDGKDIFIANHYIDKRNNGYILRDRQGQLNPRRFMATLDYSLDLIKMEEVYEKVYRNRQFYEYDSRGHKCTRHVINVTFKYSNKEFNRIATGVYVKFGYSQNDITFVDNACVKDGELVGIRVLPLKEKHIDEKYIVTSPLPQEILGKYFIYDKNSCTYRACLSIETLNSVADIRKDLYENGFVCDGIKYVRFKRSSGSSRVGKCLFIDEKMYKKMHDWELCGLKMSKGQECDLASFEPYIALTLSSIIDTLEISSNEILVIDDFESTFKTTCMATKLSNDNKLITSPKEVDMSNSIWDGQSLLDSSKFGNYSNYGMLLLRTRFFKSACFNTNLQQWFADNNITSVSQLNGYTQATDISEIKLVTTPSSIKYLKFGSLEDWLWSLEPVFGIVKHEKPTRYFGGKMVQTHYQLLNTLQMSEDEVAEFLTPTIDYIDKLRTDSAVFRHHIKYSMQDYNRATPLITKNDVVYRMLGLNDKFQYTKMYKSFCNETVRAFTNNVRKGHVLVKGNYSTLFGNPMEMLKQTIGTFDGSTVIASGEVSCKRFSDGVNLVCSRSPHVTMGNILCCKNVIIQDIEKYFNLSNEIICINSIQDNILERLSGSDFDSDTVLVTDNEILYKCAMRNYGNFLVPTKLIKSKKSKRKYTAQDKADLDIKTGKNKIGEIINLSQELNSKLWEMIYQGASSQDEGVQRLYADIAQLDVMSNLEIDSAKRENPANNTDELKVLKDKYACYENGKYIRPLFFEYLDKSKGYNNGKKIYKPYHTTMDYVVRYLKSELLKIQRRRAEDNNSSKLLSFNDVLPPLRKIEGRVYYEQVERIITMIQDTKDELSQVWIYNRKLKENPYLFLDGKGVSEALKIDGGNISCYQISEEIVGQCADKINRMKISNKTMRYLLSIIESPIHSKYKSLLLRVLFSYANEDFNSLIANGKEKIDFLVEDNNGDIKLYDMSFLKERR